MDVLFILIALPILAIVAYSVYRKFRGDERELSRHFAFDDEGVHSAGEIYPIQFKGSGGQTTRAIRLESGRYRLRYRFPNSVSIRVELFDEAETVSQVLLSASGDGETAFEVEFGGLYRLDIDSDDDSSHWKLEIEHG